MQSLVSVLAREAKKIFMRLDWFGRLCEDLFVRTWWFYLMLLLQRMDFKFFYYLRWLFQLPEMLRPDLEVSKVCIIILCLSHRWVYYLPLVLWWWNPQSAPLLTERFTRLTCLIQHQVCVCVCERGFFQPAKTFNICVVLGWFKVASFLTEFSFCSHNNHPILYKENWVCMNWV